MKALLDQIKDRLQQENHGVPLPKLPRTQHDPVEGDEDDSREFVSIEEQVAGLRREVAHLHQRAEALEEGLEKAEEDNVVLIAMVEDPIPVPVSEDTPPGFEVDTFADIHARMTDRYRTGSDIPIDTSMRDKLESCAADLARVLRYIGEQVVMDDLSKINQLDGSKPWAVVPQRVLARLMSGANIVVEYCANQALLRGISLSGQDRGDLYEQLVMKGHDLESKMRLAHGLPALPRRPR